MQLMKGTQTRAHAIPVPHAPCVPAVKKKKRAAKNHNTFQVRLGTNLASRLWPSALPSHLQQTFDGFSRLLQSDPRQLGVMLQDIGDQLAALAPSATRGGAASALPHPHPTSFTPLTPCPELHTVA